MVGAVGVISGRDQFAGLGQMPALTSRDSADSKLRNQWQVVGSHQGGPAPMNCQALQSQHRVEIDVVQVQERV